MANTHIHTVGSILKASTDYLAARDVFEARKACELLMSRLLNCRPLELYVKFDNPLSEAHVDAMRRGVKRLGTGEPAQYIVGRVVFMQHVFAVDRRALIPRPETEFLVDAVLGCEAVWNVAKPAVIEIGTGSGCIIVSLALARPGGSYSAIDVSEEALTLAIANAGSLGAADRITFSRAALSDAVEPDSMDAIVANLPYVSTADWETLSPHIKNFEPRLALDGGPDGLAVIRDIVPDAWFALKPGGSIFLEIGADQGERVTRLLTDAEFGDVKVQKDLAGFDRVVSARRLLDT